MVAEHGWQARLADAIEARGWATLAIFGLELFKPLMLFGGHVMMLLVPLFSRHGKGDWSQWMGLLQDPAMVEELIVRLERTRGCTQGQRETGGS